ncbi:MAG TPA: cyclodeaminase/cyclohydrolase family protein [Solirubrobacterales bacterium]|jgi:formiminotetrahydrofolate cyclodeaminase|nr:cyclodeaminase/cyclohydrolase family protein [Solirubrobacterales bacterium]
MAELGSRAIGEALDVLASQGEPAAAGVASAITAAAAAGVVELAAGLAAKRVTEQGRNDDADRMRELVQQAGKLRARLLAAGDEDARAYARVTKARAGHGRDRALDRASDPPLAIAEGAAGVAERAAEVADAGDWSFTADAVVAGELAAAAARGCAQLVEANLAGEPGDPRPARARAAADLAERASRNAADGARTRRSTVDSATG